MLYLNFEDERLVGMQATDLQWVVEDCYRLTPHLRDRQRVTFFFDEIQVVARWELFARRVIDTETADLFLTGSSAERLPPACAGGADPPVPLSRGAAPCRNRTDRTLRNLVEGVEGSLVCPPRCAGSRRRSDC